MRQFYVAVVTLLMSLFFVISAYAETNNQILIIESYHPVLEWTRLCEEGIRENLRNNYEFHTFYMDTKRIAPEKFQEQADRAWEMYQEIKPDLVILGDDNALRFLGKRFANTYTPVVFFGINNNPRNYFDVSPKNITGVLERTPLIPWLRYLREILPKAQRALVLMDSSQSSTSIINVTFKDRTEISVSGMHVEYKIVSDWNEWQNTIKQQAEFDLIVSPTFHSIKVKSGGYIDVEDLIRWTSKNSDVPFFTNQDYTVFPEGAVGAYTLDAKAHGAQVAKMVASILEDKIVPRNMMYIMDRQGLFVFNEAQLKRFGISIPEPINSKATWR